MHLARENNRVACERSCWQDTGASVVGPVHDAGPVSERPAAYQHSEQLGHAAGCVGRTTRGASAVGVGKLLPSSWGQESVSGTSPVTATDGRACRCRLTQDTTRILCEHSLGNPRVLMQMADDLLLAAAQRQIDRIDEKLYLEVFAPPKDSRARTRTRA